MCIGYQQSSSSSGSISDVRRVEPTAELSAPAPKDCNQWFSSLSREDEIKVWRWLDKHFYGKGIASIGSPIVARQYAFEHRHLIL